MSNENTIITASTLGIAALTIPAIIAFYFRQSSANSKFINTSQEFEGDYEDQELVPNIPGAPSGTMSSFYGTGRKHKKTKKIKRNHKKQKSIKK